VIQIDHEDAPAQYEVNFKYTNALTTADNLTRFKLAAHAIAEKNGLVYSGMAKPFADRPGSGMHFHLSFTDKQGKAAFSDNGATLNAMGMHALGGLLHHARALTAIHAPTVNSYKRLTGSGSQSGTTWAPVYIGWGSNNRTLPARVTAGRIEWRVPDPTCNIYLAIASSIWAILDGVDKRILPPAANESDVYEQTSHAPRLPHSLAHALDALDADRDFREQIGEEICKQFIAVKRAELDAYHATIHDWEWQRYGAAY
jgi:glutamine synthetase